VRELIDAAVNAAGKAGLRAAVVIVDGQKVPATGPMDGEAGKQMPVLEQRIEELTRELEAARAVPPGAGVDTSALDGALKEAEGKLEAERGKAAALTDQLAAARAEVEALRAGGTAPPQPPMDGTTIDFDTQEIAFLGLEGKVERALKKVGCGTVGELKAKYLAADADAFRKEAKLTKDQMIAIGMALAGRAPSSSAVPTAKPDGGKEAAPVNAAAGVPAGHIDRPWPERYRATRAKVVRMEASDAKIKELREGAAKEHPDAVVDGVLDLHKLPPEEADAIRTEEGTYNTVRGQVIAGIWHCGLDPTAGTLDAALERAGIDASALPAE